MILRNFAVIEGCDGAGTTTQLDRLQRRFAAPEPDSGGGAGSDADSGTKGGAEQGVMTAAEPQSPYGLPLFATCEPTGGPAGRLIRRVLKGKLFVRGETLARLFAVDRREHLYGPGGIVERCNRGELAVSDRYTPSSLVYQGLECGKELPLALNISFPHPELLVYLDIPPRTAMERISGRKDREIYEKPDFQQKVRASYLKLLPLLEKEGVRVLFLDGERPPETLAKEIWRAVREMPIIHNNGKL
ncbi:MAG: dTMP kinase [Treponema sp.]|nr:dTMP kinase [Treponema sp.]